MLILFLFFSSVPPPPPKKTKGTEMLLLYLWVTIVSIELVIVFPPGAMHHLILIILLLQQCSAYHSLCLLHKHSNQVPICKQELLCHLGPCNLDIGYQHLVNIHFIMVWHFFFINVFSHNLFVMVLHKLSGHLLKVENLYPIFFISIFAKQNL